MKRKKHVKKYKVKSNTSYNQPARKNKNKNKTITDIPSQIYKGTQTSIEYYSKNCSYYKNGLCLRLDNKCNPLSVRCINYTKTSNTPKKVSTNINHREQEKEPKITTKNIGLSAIVISDNRKCTFEKHNLYDIYALVRIVKSDGTIIDYKILAAYCETCNKYIVLKRDFDKAKEQGVILCTVIDKTVKGISKQRHKTLGVNESLLHQLGYNVKKNNGLTEEQRHIILANIIENTKLTKHEIKSCIERPMRQHFYQDNYARAVQCWQRDLEFINEYQIGDIPEVKLDNIVVSKSV